jgi:hypothetical protein
VANDLGVKGRSLTASRNAASARVATPFPQYWFPTQ